MTSMPDLTIALSIIFIMEQNRHCAIMAIIKILLKKHISICRRRACIPLMI